MKATFKKKSSQKGASPTIVIIGVVIAVILGGAILLLGLSGLRKTTPVVNNQQIQPSPQSQGETVFDKVEDASYIFYYPKGYVKGEVVRKNEILRYKNSSSKAVSPEIIFLEIENVGGKLDQPNYEFCRKFAEQFRKKDNDEITAELVYGGLGGGKGFGCKTLAKSKINGVNDEIVVIQKNLYNTQDIKGTLYSVTLGAGILFG